MVGGMGESGSQLFLEPLSFGNLFRFSLKVVYSKNAYLLIRNSSTFLCIAFELQICL